MEVLETELSEDSVSSELETLRRRVAEMKRFNRTFMGLEPGEIEGVFEKIQRKRDHQAMLDERDLRQQVIEEQEALSKELPKREVSPLKVITEEELEDYISRGWKPMYAYNNGSCKLVVEKLGA